MVLYNHDLGPFKAVIGYLRLVPFPDDIPPGEAERFTVERMSYEEEDIDRNPDAVINATSEPCGIELVKDGKDAWVVMIGGQFHSRHTYRKRQVLNPGPAAARRVLSPRSAWDQAKRTIIELTVLDWMAML